MKERVGEDFGKAEPFDGVAAQHSIEEVFEFGEVLKVGTTSIDYAPVFLIVVVPDRVVPSIIGSGVVPRILEGV